MRSTLSDHSRIKLEINNIKIIEKSPNTGRSISTPLNEPLIKEEDSKQNLNIIELNENRSTMCQTCETQLNQSQKGNE